MSDTRERRISYDELRYMLATCQRCRAEISVDLANERQTENMTGTFHPTCPICGAPFDSNVGVALRDFVRWYQHLRQAGRSVGFRLQEPEARPGPGATAQGDR